jgi:AcrR family transcriptional regulator
MKKPSYQPRKLPRQPRSVKTVTWILDAASRILDKESLEAFNTNRVAEVAGVSIGSVYQYFPNKDALIVALIERVQGELATEISFAIESSKNEPFIEGVSRLIRVAIDHQYKRPRLSRILDLEEMRLRPEPILEQAASRMETALVQFLGRHHDEITVTNLAEAAKDIMTITKALVDAHTLTPREAALLEQRATRATLGYLCHKENN